MEQVLPDKNAAGVVENNEQDREALEFVEHREAATNEGRELDFEFGHGVGLRWWGRRPEASVFDALDGVGGQ